MTRLLLSLFVAIGLTSVSSAQEAIVPASKDNTLFESDTGALSNGAGAYLFTGSTRRVGVRRALIQFDLSSTLPDQAMIDSVRLTLNMSKTVSGPTPVSLHRLSTDWGEGTSEAPRAEGTGTDATTGDATWLHTFFSDQTWQTAGGDFASESSATTDVGAPGPYSWSSEQMVADVEGWVARPDSNFGWLVLGSESPTGLAKRFDSRENPIESNRPALHIFYRVATSVEGEVPILAELSARSWPNPFIGATNVEFGLDTDAVVTFDVIDVAGRLVERRSAGRLAAGTHSIRIDGADLASGLYLVNVTAQTGGRVATQSVTVVRTK